MDRWRCGKKRFFSWWGFCNGVKIVRGASRRVMLRDSWVYWISLEAAVIIIALALHLCMGGRGRVIIYGLIYEVLPS